MKSVVFFRHQLFKISEPFITQQAEKLASFRPIYVGRSRFGSAPEGARSLALEDMEKQQRFSRRLWQVVTRDPSSYMDLLEQQRPALIHAQFGVEGVYALPLARKLKIPLVTSFLGFDATTKTSALLNSSSPSWIIYALFRKQLAKEGNVFLCVSEYIRQRVIDLGFPEERTHVQYFGIDTQRTQPRCPSEERPIILHVGRLVEKKGTEYLIRAFAEISSLTPEVELVIVGDGPLRGSLEALAHSLGLAARIHFMGSLPHTEVEDLMRVAMVLAAPSITSRSGDMEGLPNVILEAAALGVPVIGSFHSGIPEAVEDGKTGYLVVEREVNTLAERMYELINDHTLRISMGTRARSLIEARFDVQKQTVLLEKHYQNVIS